MPTIIIPQEPDAIHTPGPGVPAQATVTAEPITNRSELFGCTPAAVADVLDRAADRIHALGLWQGAGDTPGTCIVLALNYVTGQAGRRLMDAALESLTGHLHLTEDPALPAADLVEWNDVPGRTAAEVCGEMRACAAGLRITSDASGYRAAASVTA